MMNTIIADSGEKFSQDQGKRGKEEGEKGNKRIDIISSSIIVYYFLIFLLFFLLFFFS